MYACDDFKTQQIVWRCHVRMHSKSPNCYVAYHLPLQEAKSRWHSSYVLIYIGPLLIYLFIAVPSILTLRYIPPSPWCSWLPLSPPSPGFQWHLVPHCHSADPKPHHASLPVRCSPHGSAIVLQFSLRSVESCWNWTLDWWHQLVKHADPVTQTGRGSYGSCIWGYGVAFKKQQNESATKEMSSSPFEACMSIGFMRNVQNVWHLIVANQCGIF